MRKHRRLFIVVRTVFLTMICYLIFLSSNWHGFGVDSSGRLYLGNKEYISILENSQEIQKIPLPLYRTYYFTVQADDTIIVATESCVYIIDSCGNVLSSRYEEGDTTYSQLQHQKLVLGADGEQYLLQKYLGRKIIKDKSGTVIYKEPLNEYVGNLVFSLPFLLIVLILAFSDWQQARPKS